MHTTVNLKIRKKIEILMPIGPSKCH